VWAAKNLNIQTIAITTGLGFAFTHQGLISNIVKKLYKWSFKYAAEVWFLNEDDSMIFINNKIIPKSKAFILPSEGINTEFFKADPRQEESASFSFLFSARLILDKGIEEFVQAIQILYEKGYPVMGNIVGFLDVSNPKGISKALLDTWTKQAYINYLGSTPDIRPYIQNCSCVVLPSYYREGVPRILLEAASMEKPIITTDNVGCREVVDDKLNGYLCKMKDAGDLADKMEQFMKLSNEQRKSMGLHGRQKIKQQFDEGIIFKYYTDCIEKYIG
jgi:glycosyltransferase involved in cell wall biosynthesis